MSPLSCFKAYDIRGRIPDELNEGTCYAIGRAYAQLLKPGRVAVGRDVRPTSAGFCAALTRGLCDGGTDVLDIGLCGTEEIYFAAMGRAVDGGIMVTASHNPLDYNGMKLVREGARPISGDSGLNDLRDLVERGGFIDAARKGRVTVETCKKAYVEHLLSYVDSSRLPRRKVVVNAGNGCAGPVLDLLEEHLPVEFIKIHHAPDGGFPNGIPNPLLPENRAATSAAVRRYGADLGLAWDGDFDRCFFFDERGEFVEGYYVVGLLAATLLARHPGSRIVHDPRLTWNTIEMVREAGGEPIMCKTGHAFIKERMRAEDAIYGGEMSAHHYFRDFAYCDSGMIPWLLVLDIMGRTGRKLSQLVGERIARFPASGEINRVLADPEAALRRVEEYFAGAAVSVDRTDGLSLEFPVWRFNLRSSNTEAVVRLNVESRADVALMKGRTEEILDLLDSLP